MDRKTAIITGAARGIGAQIAKTLAADGFNVVINDMCPAEKAEETINECKAFGVEALFIQADVSKLSDCEEMVKKVTETFGGVDVLVNNAGITRDALMLRMTEEQFDLVINVNLKSAFNMCKLISPILLKRKGGRIINISSVAGVYGNAGQVNYSASKAGMIGITKSLSKELGSRGITVNAVAPGFIDTEMTRSLPDAVKQGALNQISLRRFGQIEDIGNVVAFLASDKAAYITGQVLVVDGGLAL